MKLKLKLPKLAKLQPEKALDVVVGVLRLGAAVLPPVLAAVAGAAADVLAAVDDAIDPGSDGGAAITSKEWGDIVQAFGDALAERLNLQPED